jgi:hypothetical protein
MHGWCTFMKSFCRSLTVELNADSVSIVAPHEQAILIRSIVLFLFLG